MSNPYKDRSAHARLKVERDFPPRAFLYTVPQIAEMLSVTTRTLRSWLFYEGRSTGVQDPTSIRAVNIAPASEPPEWRLEEDEVVRWMRLKGIRLYKYKLPDDY